MTDRSGDPIEEVASASEKFRKAREDRDLAIRNAREAGLSLRKIAAAAGVHHTTIQVIEEREP